MYVNAKWYLLKPFQESKEGRIKKSGGGGKFIYDIINTL
jgi:hypothetical protein